ncbi:Na(+)-translocating NADH-quinone reductase subunit C [Zunongwangia sp. F363]|uniref:Na(+)-translocating NADH-quinone reductase subunit C n=1 Tax=Autumnicola tepida TaxID=3075595 RepID=A0ABU3C5Q6_9FLAO|nr:Na(+)-translocating NADH-quinone reductase subunit C [Zunongwangia sp. F363]MDT0641678.1 Na(+)-translocating NADH-quinone reductase subunit C [Zunongwangia sp. F363]
MEEKSVNKTNSNGYTFMFAIIMVLVVASVLAFTATSLQPTQYENVRQEKMQSILNTIGIETDRPGAQALYDQYITEEIALREDGSVAEDVDAFAVDLAKEIKMEDNEQIYPLYVADYEGKTYYIIPLRGNGLWNAIFGYISLEDDINTIKGATFDHLGETPGLGAQITKAWFRESFVGKKIFDKTGKLEGVSVVKGGASTEHEVDAISGATITGNGVSNMISERLRHYIPYFQEHTDMKLTE